MDPAVFEEWMMIILVTVLIGFMGFIVWDLAKKSKAGRFGTLILFFVLGLGVLAFIIKSVVVGVSRRGVENSGPFAGTPAPTGLALHLRAAPYLWERACPQMALELD
ncbi:hypothetical protein PPS11_11536 [Pseudomonas putida S11]|nr:hypothetical protein PPS11_11536 [Pseudomonas putida S11]